MSRARSHTCSKCQQTSSRFCNGCDLYYCSNCCQKRHRKGSFLRHDIVEILGEEEAAVPLCDECAAEVVVLRCRACELQFCGRCSEQVHQDGTMQTHVQQGHIEHLAKKTTANDAQTIATGLAEALLASGEVEVQPAAAAAEGQSSSWTSSSSSTWNTTSTSAVTGSNFAQWLPSNSDASSTNMYTDITETYKSLTTLLPAVDTLVSETNELFRLLSITADTTPSRNLVVTFRSPMDAAKMTALHDFLREFGDLQYFNSCPTHAQLALIGYFDLNTAIRAEYHIKQSILSACNSDLPPVIASALERVCFGIPFNSSDEYETGCVYITISVTCRHITIPEVQAFFSQWGVVVRVEAAASMNTFVVEFSDRRITQKAQREIHGFANWGGELCVQVVPCTHFLERTQQVERRLFLDQTYIEENPINYQLKHWTSTRFGRPVGNMIHPIPNTPPVPLFQPRVSSYPATQGTNPTRSATFTAKQQPRSTYTNGTSRHASSSSGRNDQGSGDFCLHIENVKGGLDKRTTLMIRNIPNKYTQHMLLSEINVYNKELYDFFYLPIDFKNKCNMGYAFINFIDYASIVPFYQEFSNQRWRNFNSEKVCAISYARLQGKAAMIARFQNSSLLDKDESYRPLVFASLGGNRGKAEPFPVGKTSRKNSLEDVAAVQQRTARSSFPQMMADLEPTLPT